MSIFKNLFHFKPKKIEQETPKKEECWYNNAHEKGEAVKGATPVEGAGSVNSFENHESQSAAMH